MPSKKNILHMVWLFLFANSVNIVFYILRLYGVVMIRPIVVYEYLLIPFLIVLRVPRGLIWTYFIAIFLFDVVSELSFIYLFNVIEFARNLEFYLLYNFSLHHYVFFISFILCLLLSWWILKKLMWQKEQPLGFALGVFTVVFLFIYVIDTLNGKTLINGRRILSTTNVNLGASVLRDVFLLVNDLNTQALRPVIKKDKSIAFRAFENDSTGNQLLIIIESWGLPSSDEQWRNFKETVIGRTTQSGWQCTFGESPFKGGTVHSELRELLNVTGDYHYFLNPENARSFESIFTIKKKQGYTTTGIHSFSSKMFLRDTWWKNIGVDSAYFLENVIGKMQLQQNELNYSSPFPSLHDEDAFLFINNKQASEKRFVYFLTVNTHLPFVSEVPDKDILEKNGMSDYLPKPIIN